MFKQKTWFVLIFVIVLLLAGCVGKKDPVKEHQGNEASGFEKGELPYQSPLTGIGTKEEPSTRAYAVVINNHPKARPQSGLNQADIVYEVLAEGNITRFLAIFQSEQPEKIGPVRSARDYLIALAQGYDALFVAHGYSPEAKKMLDSGIVDHINGMNYDGTLFKRAKDRVAPHNSYISSENIFLGAKKLDYDMDNPPDDLLFLTDEEIEQLSGENAQTVEISYSSNDKVTYEYDPESEEFKRYANGELTADLDSNEPVRLDNIFIVEASHRVIDNHGRREIDLTSGGNAYLLQKGKWKQVEWKNVDGKILPFENGKEAGLVPGKTWINIIPTNPGLAESVIFNHEE